MEEKNDDTQIRDICHYATLAAREEDPDNASYHQYLRSFEGLLRSHIARIDAEKTTALQEMISVIFIVYDDMLDSPDQEASQSDKLARYIKTLLAQIKQDTAYLQKWSMQSCIDALLQTNQLDNNPLSDSSETLEEFVESNLQELEALLLVEQQKINLQHADDLINDDDDDDQLSKEMEKILHFSSADMYPESPPTAPVKPLEITIPDTLVLRDDEETLSEAGMESEQHFNPIQRQTTSPNLQNERPSSTDSHTTNADDRSSVNTNRPNSSAEFKDLSPARTHHSDDALLLPFTERFHTLIGQFHGNSFAKNMDPTDSVAFENTTDQIVKTLLDAYKHCFQQGLNAESVADFDKVFQSITSHWSYWSDADLSKSNSAVMEQAVLKLNKSLLKLTDDMQQNLPDELRQRSFKDPK